MMPAPVNRPPRASVEHFCTVFDHEFLPDAPVMHESLLAHCPRVHLWIICADNLEEEQSSLLNLPSESLIPLRDVETPELLAVKGQRNNQEYCWTLTPFTHTAYPFPCSPHSPSRSWSCVSSCAGSSAERGTRGFGRGPVSVAVRSGSCREPSGSFLSAE
jgi:hypothetical protein